MNKPADLVFPASISRNYGCRALKKPLMFVAALLIPPGFWTFTWIGGYELSLQWFYLCVLFYAMLIILGLALIFWGIWNIFRICHPGSIKNLALCMISLASIYLATLYEVPAQMYFHGFKARCERDLDPSALQQWAVPKIGESSDHHGLISKQEYPAFLVRMGQRSFLGNLVFGPAQLKVFYGDGMHDDNGHYTLLVVWARMLEIYVGDKEFNSNDDALTLWKPGIYFALSPSD